MKNQPNNNSFFYAQVFDCFVLCILRLFKLKTEGQTIYRKLHCKVTKHKLKLEIVFTTAAPAFDILFTAGCVLNTKVVYTTAEKLTFFASPGLT